MLGRRLHSYFEYWRTFAGHKTIQLQSNFKQRLISLHHKNVAAAFTKFKNYQANEKKVTRAILVLEAESTCESLRSEVFEGKRQ